MSAIVLKIRDTDSIENFSLVDMNMYMNLNLGILCFSPKFVSLNSTHILCAYGEITSSPCLSFPFLSVEAFNPII